MTNILSTSAALVAASAVRAMPMPVLAASDSVRQYCLPTHVMYKGSLADLAADGVKFVEHRDNGFALFDIPAGWSIHGTELSVMQHRLYDDAGRCRAKLFYQPGSAGAGGEIMVLERDNDEPMLDMDAVYAPVQQLSVYLAKSDKPTEYCLPTKIWHGKTVADVEAMGIKLVAQRGHNYALFSIPAGWSIVESPVSMFQLRLYDDAGLCRAKIFTKPGSQGGGAEMELQSIEG